MALMTLFQFCFYSCNEDELPRLKVGKYWGAFKMIRYKYWDQHSNRMANALNSTPQDLTKQLSIRSIFVVK